MRPQAMVRLTMANLRVDENGDHIIVVRDKGGKDSIQLILPHEVEFVKNILSTNAEGKPLAPGERPFSQKDLKQIAFSKYRIERAQQLEEYFEKRFNGWKNMPSRFPHQRHAREKAKKAAMAEKAMWIEKLWRNTALHIPMHPRSRLKNTARSSLVNHESISVRAIKSAPWN